jgi:tetratricopeptide (TPR) repeat protein
MLLFAGRLAQQSGRSEAAYRFWRQSLAVGGRRQHERLMKIIPDVPFDDLLEHVLPPSPELMLVMARDRNRLAAAPEQRDALTAKARLLLESPDVVLSDIERPYWKAVAARLDGRLDEAVTCYQQALARSPDAVNWRMELAETFHDAGNLDEAIREARKCTWMESAPPSAGKLLEKLVHQKLTASPQPGGQSAEDK